MTSPTGLVVRGLTVTYRRRPALRGVGLDAPAGAVTGVIGPNGAGKSTLLKAVLGLIRPDAGTVMAGGRPVAEVRRAIAYLPQRSGIDWDYPAQVREVVTMGRTPHIGLVGRLRPADRRHVAEALDRVGLADLARRPVGELSGGQQQRVLFARALAQQASLYLLDEPFAAVDAVTVTLLSALLRELAAAGAAIVLVNHDLSAIDPLCDRLLVLNTVLIAEGPTADVLTEDVLARAYGAVPRSAPVGSVPR